MQIKIGPTPTTPHARFIPSRKALMLGVILALVAAVTFVSLGFASYAASTTTTTTTSPGSSSSTYAAGANGGHCPNMGSQSSGVSSSSSTTTT